MSRQPAVPSLDPRVVQSIDVEIVAPLLQQRNELLAALKDTREACAALMRAVAVDPRGPAIAADWKTELGRMGIAKGFGVRADAAIAKAEGRS